MGEVPENWKKGNVTSFFKRGKEEYPGNYKPVNLISIPGKVMEQTLLETILKNLNNNTMRDKKVIGNSHHGFFEGQVMPD